MKQPMKRQKKEQGREAIRSFAAVFFEQNMKGGIEMKSKMKLLVVFCAALALTLCLAATAYAAPTGDVAGAIEGTWNDASGQIKTVVNNVVFPAIDLILAVFFFAKLGMAYFDCAPVKAL